MDKLLTTIGLVLMMTSCSVPKMEQHKSRYLLLSQFSTVQDCINYADKNNIDSVLFDICLHADTVLVPKGIYIKGIENIFADTIIYENIN